MTELEVLVELEPQITLDDSSSKTEEKAKRTRTTSKKTPLPDNASDFTIFSGKKSVFSMQYPIGFVIKGKLFKSVEQYLLYKKAILFNDVEAAQRILETDNITEQKKLASQVRDVDTYRWNKHSIEYLYEANRAKFIQHNNLREELFATRGTLIAEASATDKYWATGLSATKIDIYDKSKWTGLNLLGESLTQLREDLYSGLEMNKIIEEAVEKYISIIAGSIELPEDITQMQNDIIRIIENIVQAKTAENEKWVLNLEEQPEPVHFLVEHQTTFKTARFPITLMMLHTLDGNKMINQVAYWRDIQDLEECISLHLAHWDKGYHITITNDSFYIDGDDSELTPFSIQKNRGRVNGTLSMRVEDSEETVTLRGNYLTDKWIKRESLYLINQQLHPIGWR